jgi:octaprenyl-diphosphate synthase
MRAKTRHGVGGLEDWKPQVSARPEIITPGVATDDEPLAAPLARVEMRLREVASDAPPPVGEAALHLVAAGGKRVRPRVLLHAARVGSRQNDAVVELAVAAELVHNASLLHDDVIDEAPFRRSRPAARVLWGNAHSVLAGDHLMAGAFEVLESAGVPGALGSMIATIRRLVAAEVVQLAHRGALLPDERTYYAVVRGKTAALFAWCAETGARASGASPSVSAALASYGEEVGVAFQICDDLLDLSGSQDELGKSLLADLQQGIATLPLVLAARERPELASAFAATGVAHRAGPGSDPGDLARLVKTLAEETGALEAARSRAREHVGRARAALQPLGDSPAHAVLDSLALGMLDRTS